MPPTSPFEEDTEKVSSDASSEIIKKDATSTPNQEISDAKKEEEASEKQRDFMETASITLQTIFGEAEKVSKGTQNLDISETTQYKDLQQKAENAFNSLPVELRRKAKAVFESMPKEAEEDSVRFAKNLTESLSLKEFFTNDQVLELTPEQQENRHRKTEILKQKTQRVLGESLPTDEIVKVYRELQKNSHLTEEPSTLKSREPTQEPKEIQEEAALPNTSEATMEKTTREGFREKTQRLTQNLLKKILAEEESSNKTKKAKTEKQAKRQKRTELLKKKTRELVENLIKEEPQDTPTKDKGSNAIPLGPLTKPLREKTRRIVKNLLQEPQMETNLVPNPATTEFQTPTETPVPSEAAPIDSFIEGAKETLESIFEAPKPFTSAHAQEAPSPAEPKKKPTLREFVGKAKNAFDSLFENVNDEVPLEEEFQQEVKSEAAQEEVAQTKPDFNTPPQITEEPKKALEVPVVDLSKITKRQKKTELLKKKSQRFIKILIADEEEKAQAKPIPRISEEEKEKSSFYKFFETLTLVGLVKVLNPPDKDKLSFLEKEIPEGHESLKSRLLREAKTSWINPGAKNKGAQDQSAWRYITISLFALLLIAYLNKEEPAPPPAKVKKKIARKGLKSSLAKENQTPFDPLSSQEESKTPPLDPKVREQQNKTRLQAEKAILNLYFQKTTNEEKELEELLSEYDLTFQTIDQLSKEELAQLEPEDLSFLAKFQQKKRTIDWVKKEVQEYQNIDFSNKTILLEKRKRLLKQGANVSAGLITKLSDPYLTVLTHKELCHMLGMLQDKRAFSPLVTLRQKETNPEKKLQLLFPLIQSGKTKAFPSLIQILSNENSSPAEIEVALTYLSMVVSPGQESALVPFLSHKKNKIVEIVKNTLIELNTSAAKEILNKAQKAGKITSIKRD